MMNFKRTATIALAGGALIAWLAGAATSMHPPSPIDRVPSTAIDQRSDVLASEIAKLHERLHPTATPRQPARILSASGGAGTPIAAAPPPAAAPAIADAVPVGPPQPSL